MVIIILLGVSLLSSCGNFSKQGNIEKVGMLLEGSIDGKSWDEKGYQGLLNIRDEYKVDVFYKEHIKTEQEVADAVDEFVRKGTNLIFGHSNIYGKYFMELSHHYPEVHFVYFNGARANGNVTSLNFNSHAMGFFAGMLASNMSKTGRVGVIATYEWQPEIEGFYEGVKYEDASKQVLIEYVHDWNDQVIALDLYKGMKNNYVDVYYPAGDSFNEKIIKAAAKDGLYAFGYIEDQSKLDSQAVVTSTVQQIDLLYKLTAEAFNEGTLKGGTILSYDFQDGLVSLGKFSPDVPKTYISELQDAIKTYEEKGLLPNQYDNND